jgi:hypothetical protein
MEIVIECQIIKEQHDGYCSDPESLDDEISVKKYNTQFDKIFDNNGNFIPTKILEYNYSKPSCGSPCYYQKKSYIIRIYNPFTNIDIPFKFDYFSNDKCIKLDEEVHNYTPLPKKQDNPILYDWLCGKRFYPGPHETEEYESEESENDE